MTSPSSVGAVSIEIIGDASRMAKQARKDFQKEFDKLDLRKLIADQNRGKKPVVVPVEADVDVDTKAIPEKVKKTRVPKVPVELDPLVQAFQEEVRRNVRSLSRQTVKLPVNADTDKLKGQLTAELAKLKAETRIQVPTEPGGKAAYEAKLRTQLAEIARRIKQNVTIEVDVDKSKLTGSGGLGGAVGGIGRLLGGLLGAVPGLGRVSSGVTDLTGQIQKLSGTSAQLGGALAGSFTSALGPIGAAVSVSIAAAGALAAIGTGAALAVPVLGALAAALVAVAGAAAALPAAAAGFGAAAATLGLGFSGISDAFKKRPSGGGSGGGGGSKAPGEDPAARARRIAAAERGVESARRGINSATRNVQSAERGYGEALARVSEAQARAAKAQGAINKARAEARERIEDLNRSLKGAKLSEEDAALGVTEALRNLNQVKETGILPDIQRADLEYRQAIQTLEEAKDTTSDLGKESAEANKKGVAGSDEVQGALEDQRDALKAVRDAQLGVLDAQDSLTSANEGLLSAIDSRAAAYDALAEAQKKAVSAGSSGGGGSAGFFDNPKLAPNAQKFVDAIKRLKPAFEALRLDVQNRLFKDLDKTVAQLAKGYEEPLKQTLGSYADTFNAFFRKLGTAVTTPKFIADLQIGAEGARQGLAKIGDAITTSLVPAFGSLSRAAGPFLSKLGDEIAGVVTSFSKWISDAERTGKLKSFFATASEAVHDLFTTGKQVTRIIGNLFRIIFNGDGKKGKSGIDSFNDGLKKFNEFLEDPATQQRIQDFIADAKELFETFKKAFDKTKGFLDVLFPPDSESKGKSKGSTLGEEIGKALVAGILAGIVTGMRLQFNILVALLTGPGTPIDAIKKAFGIQSPSTVTAEIGGYLIDGLVKGIKDKLKTLTDKARELPARVKAGIGDATTQLKQKGRQLIDGLVAGVGERFTNLRTRAGQIRTTVSNALSNAGTFLRTHGRNLVAGLINGIGERFTLLRSRALGLKTTIGNALNNAGTLLIGAGRAVVDGLKEGIRRAVPGLGTLLGAVTTFIRDNKGPIEKDRKLLVPAGRAIMDGLIGGIGDKRQALAAELADVTTLVAGTSFDSLGSAGDAALTSSLSAHAEQKLLLEIAPGVSGDWFRDGLRKNIKFSHNGNVQSALGS